MQFSPFFKSTANRNVQLLFQPASVPWTSCCNWVNLRISLISDCLFAVSLQFLGVRFDFVELLHVRPKFNRVTGRTFLSVMTPAALDYTSTIRVGPTGWSRNKNPLASSAFSNVPPVDGWTKQFPIFNHINAVSFNFLICLDGCWMQQHYFPFFIDCSVLAKFYSISIGCRPLFPTFLFLNWCAVFWISA